MPDEAKTIRRLGKRLDALGRQLSESSAEVTSTLEVGDLQRALRNARFALMGLRTLTDPQKRAENIEATETILDTVEEKLKNAARSTSKKRPKKRKKHK